MTLPTATPQPTLQPDYSPTMDNLIPKPVSYSATSDTFSLTSSTRIYVEPATPELTAIGHYLADKLTPATGYGLQVSPTTGAPANGNIYLTTEDGDSSLGEEGYELTVTKEIGRAHV